MRQVKRWLAAMAVALLVPAAAGALGSREAMMERVVSERGTMVEARAQVGGLLHWFGSVLSALWGATRGAVVPDGSGGNGFTVAPEPTDGGA